MTFASVPPPRMLTYDAAMMQLRRFMSRGSATATPPRPADARLCSDAQRAQVGEEGWPATRMQEDHVVLRSPPSRPHKRD